MGRGVFWDTSDLDSMTIFIGGGVFWDTLDLDSMTIFIWGGILRHLGIDSLTIFIFGGRGEGRGVFYRVGVFCGIWTKISTTPAGSCITDSVSRTTYVETNQAPSYTFYLQTSVSVASWPWKQQRLETESHSQRSKKKLSLMMTT